MGALLKASESNVEFNGRELPLERKHEIPGHEGYFFQVHPARPGASSQTGYVVRILRGRKLVRSERVSVSHDPIKLVLHPEQPVFPLEPVFQRLLKAGIRRNNIFELEGESAYTETFWKGKVHALTDGSKWLHEWNAYKDMFEFVRASWAVVRDNDSYQVLAVYVWDHAVERDLTELYALVAEPTR